MRISFFPIFFLKLLLTLLLGSLVVMILWNSLVPNLFSVGAISYFQALGLLILCRILIGHIPFHGSPHRLLKGWHSLSNDSRQKMFDHYNRHHRGYQRGENHHGTQVPFEDFHPDQNHGRPTSPHDNGHWDGGHPADHHSHDHGHNHGHDHGPDCGHGHGPGRGQGRGHGCGRGSNTYPGSVDNHSDLRSFGPDLDKMEPRESSFGKEQAEDDHLEPHNNHKGSPASTDQQDTNQAPREKDSQPEDHATDQAPQEQGSTSKQKDES